MFSSAVSPNRPGFVSLTNFHESWFQPSSPESYFSSLPASPGYTDTLEPPGFKATVESEGYVQLLLGQGMTVDIAPNKAICLSNKEYGTLISLSGCGTQMAFEHPSGRVIQYKNRIEVQAQKNGNFRNAKIWQRGVSFTSNQSALVYLVDPAGPRSTTDTFHDLYASNISKAVFDQSMIADNSSHSARLEKAIKILEKAYFKASADGTNCWIVNNIKVIQTSDGFVTVERDSFQLKSSPNNGRARFQSNFVYLTASVGPEPHIFVRSHERRLHYNGELFVVRNGGHSAGFDDTGKISIL